MSGITGIYHPDGNAIAEQDLRRMTQVLAHRGGYPSIWKEERVGLGVQSKTDRPALCTSGPLALVADARIDNRDELARVLNLAGPARDLTDEALILAAYERWGEDCPQHLVGAFAFALWDGRNRTLLCARDHLGIRPFYYTRSDDRFAFGSEIKALLALAGVPRRLHETSAADFLLLMVEDKESTFYEGILRLPPGHTLAVTPDAVRLREYWALDSSRDLDLGSDDAYAEAFREIFEEAVRCRLRGADTPGSMLSGGLDSSSITTVAREQLKEQGRGPLDTFSLVFDEVTKSDERPHIDAVVKQGGLRPHYVHGDRTSVFEDLDRMLWHMDEPFLGPNLYLHWGMYGAAQQQGVDVVLDGLLGDSVVFHGDCYLTELAAKGRWITFGREARHIARKRGGGWKSIRSVTRRYAVSPLIVEPLRNALPALPWSEHPGLRNNHHLLNPEFLRSVQWAERAQRYDWNVLRTPRSTRAAHYAELTSGLLPVALEVVDRATAAFGIEARYPFADRRLVEFCLALPPEQRFRHGRTREILRRAMRGYLPEAIRTRRSKGNLAHAAAHNMRVLDAPVLREFMEDRLPIAEPYLNVGALQRMHHQFSADDTSPQATFPLWQAAVFVRWLERERETSQSTKLLENSSPGGAEQAPSSPRLRVRPIGFNINH